MPQRPSDPAGRAAVVHLPGTSGSELPLARFLPSGRSLLIGFAIVFGAVGLYLVARTSPMFALSRVDVVGAPPGAAARVRAALKPLDGTSLLALDGGEVHRRLAGLPEIASATYDRNFPHTLVVTVRAERPVAVARRGPDAWLVSSSARVIAAVPRRARPGLPRVWLAHSDQAPQIGALIGDRFGLRAVRTLALARVAHFGGRVRMVRAREQDLTFLLASGLELRLGDLRSVTLKLAIATKLLPGVLAQGGYSYLDVSVPERPVAGDDSQL